MVCTCVHRTFVGATFFFFKTGESVTATLGAFRAHFMLRRNDAVPDRK